MKIKKHIVFIFLLFAFSLMQAHNLVPHDHRENTINESFIVSNASDLGFINILLLNLGENHLENFNIKNKENVKIHQGFLETNKTINKNSLEIKRSNNYSANRFYFTECLIQSIPHRAPPLI
jgi:hypothetical protein